MGKPQNVTPEQYKILEKAGQLQLLKPPERQQVNKGKTVLKFELPRQGVSLIKLSW
jgi:xylan 1,4-beta-xylosidase